MSAPISIDPVLLNSSKTVFEKTSWLHIKSVQLVSNLSEEDTQKRIRESKESAVLAFHTSFKFNPPMTSLIATMQVILYPTSSNLKNLIKEQDPFKKPILKFSVSSTKTVPTPDPEGLIENNAKVWTDSECAFFKSSIDQILHELPISLENALKDPGSLKH